MTDNFEIKDSGERQEFDSGAVRDTHKGKGRYDLLPTRAIRRLAVHFENGAKKYGDNNWLKGMPLRRFAESALRHMFKALEGQKDEDHWIAAAWNILAIVEYKEQISEGLLAAKWDDLPMLPPGCQHGISELATVIPHGVTSESTSYRPTQHELQVGDRVEYTREKFSHTQLSLGSLGTILQVVEDGCIQVDWDGMTSGNGDKRSNWWVMWYDVKLAEEAYCNANFGGT